MMEVLAVQGQAHAQGQEAHRGQTALLAVIDRVLDNGLVIEDWSSVRVLGIELLTVDSEVIAASFAKYLEYAEAIEETADWSDQGDGEPEIVPADPSASVPYMR